MNLRKESEEFILEARHWGSEAELFHRALNTPHAFHDKRLMGSENIHQIYRGKKRNIVKQ